MVVEAIGNVSCERGKECYKKMDLAESTGKRIHAANLAAHPTGRINMRTSGFGKVPSYSPGHDVVLQVQTILQHSITKKQPLIMTKASEDKFQCMKLPTIPTYMTLHHLNPCLASPLYAVVGAGFI